MSDGRRLTYRFNVRKLERQAQELIRSVRKIAQARHGIGTAAQRMKSVAAPRFQRGRVRLRQGLSSFQRRHGG